MSHKGGYGGKKANDDKSEKLLETAMAVVFRLIGDIWSNGYNIGFDDAIRKTTIGSGSGRLSGNKHRPRSTGKARKPTGQKKNK